MAYAMTKRGNLDNCVTYEFMCDTVQDMNDIEDRYRTIGSIAIVLEGYSGMEVYIAGSDKQWRALSAIGGGSGSSDSSGSEGAESNLPIYVKTIEGATIEIQNVDMGSSNPQEIDIDTTLLHEGPVTIEIGDYSYEVELSNSSEYGDMSMYEYNDSYFGIALVYDPQPMLMIYDGQHTYNEPQTVRIIYPTVTTLYSTQDSLYLGTDENGGNGAKVITDNNGSIAVGENVMASGDVSQAFGSNTEASGFASHAEGNYTVASGSYSHAEGDSTQTFGDYSHAEGRGSQASGQASHAEGVGTKAGGENSHAEGKNTTAAGPYSHAEGCGYKNDTLFFNNSTYKGTGAHNSCAHSEGYLTWAIGPSTHAEGYQTQALKNYSHAEGCFTIAAGQNQHVSGKYNTQDYNNTYAEIIGNGTGTNARSNGRALDWNGNEYLKGDLYVGCSADSTGGTKVIPLPTPPSANGTYTLQCTVSSGTATYSWVSTT